MTDDDDLCPFCGAYGSGQCELEEDAGECPWNIAKAAEPDPDRLREDRDERKRMEREDDDE